MKCKKGSLQIRLIDARAAIYFYLKLHSKISFSFWKMKKKKKNISSSFLIAINLESVGLCACLATCFNDDINDDDDDDVVEDDDKR